MPNGKRLFGIDIAKIVFDALNGQLRDGVLKREVQGVRDPENLAGGRQKTVQEFPFQGILQEEKVDEMGRWKIQKTTIKGSRRVMITSQSIDTKPIPNDVLELDGDVLVVTGVSSDPAEAHFSCRVSD